MLAAALVLYFVLPDAHSDPVGSLSSQEQEAVTAASTIIADTGSYRRASFAKDYQRSLDETTGDLRKDLEARRSQLQSTLTTGKFDIYIKVRHAALVESAGAGTSSPSYQVLVSFYGYSTAAPNNPNPSNLEVTVRKTNGKWVATDASSVGVQ